MGAQQYTHSVQSKKVEKCIHTKSACFPQVQWFHFGNIWRTSRDMWASGGQCGDFGGVLPHEWVGAQSTPGPINTSSPPTKSLLRHTWKRVESCWHLCVLVHTLIRSWGFYASCLFYLSLNIMNFCSNIQQGPARHCISHTIICHSSLHEMSSQSHGSCCSQDKVKTKVKKWYSCYSWLKLWEDSSADLCVLLFSKAEPQQFQQIVPLCWEGCYGNEHHQELLKSTVIEDGEHF